MKLKKGLLIVLILSLITAVFPISALGADIDDFIPERLKFAFLNGAKVGIYNDVNKLLDAPVYTENGKMMIPAEYVFSELGYEITKDETTLTVKDKKEIVLTDNSEKITVDGEESSFSVNTTNKDGVWFVSEEIFSKLGFIYSVEKFIESFTLGVNLLEKEAKNDI